MKHSKILCFAASLLLATSAFSQAVTRAAPAGSYTTARAIDNFARQAIPDVSSLVSYGAIPGLVAAYTPASTGPSGSYCGRLVVYTDTNSITERIPCAGYSLYKDVPVEYYVPPSDGYYTGGDNPTYVDANPGYYTTVMTRVADCPPSYGLSLIGGAGPYGFYSCIKG